MLFLVFQLGTDRYAIDAAQVLEVLPLVKLKAVPNAPRGVAGVMDYHAAPVPVVDLSELATGVSSRQWMSTRIILVNYREESAGTHVLGLMAERATETMRCAADEFVDPGVRADGSPYLGPVTMQAGGMIQ